MIGQLSPIISHLLVTGELLSVAIVISKGAGREGVVPLCLHPLEGECPPGFLWVRTHSRHIPSVSACCVLRTGLALHTAACIFSSPQPSEANAVIVTIENIEKPKQGSQADLHVSPDFLLMKKGGKALSDNDRSFFYFFLYLIKLQCRIGKINSIRRTEGEFTPG